MENGAWSSPAHRCARQQEGRCRIKASEIKVNGVYVARVSGQLVQVRVDKISEGMRGIDRRRSYKIYEGTNLKTGRKVSFRSAQKFRREVKQYKGTASPLAKQVVGPMVDKLIDGGVLPKASFEINDEGVQDAQRDEATVGADVGPAGPSGDRGRGAAGPPSGRSAAEGPGGVVAAQVGSGGEQVECPDSPDGKHSFTPDMEYDSSGETVNCEHCGLAQFTEEKVQRILRKAGIKERVTVAIGRHNGPCTDQVAESRFDKDQVDLIGDVLAMVNKAASKDCWYYRVNEGAYVEPRVRS